MNGTRLLQRSDLPELLELLSQAPSVAIDTEFHTERTWAPELFLVQIGLPGGLVWLVDPGETELMAEVGPALARAAAWIVHGGAHDLRVLADSIGSVPEQVYDTQVLAALIDHEHPVGLSRLLAQVLGVQLSKRATLSDWSRRPLHEDQLRYAADDVRWLHALCDQLMQALCTLGREELARTACAQLRAEALAPPEPDTLLRELGGLPGDPVECAVLRELVVWREGVARAEDRPPRTLIGDASLRQVARTQPRSMGELLDQRRLPRSFVRAHAAALLQAVATGREVASSRPSPVVAPGTPAADRAFVLRMVIELAGRQERFAPGLVAPPHLRDDLCLHPPTDRHEIARRIGSWRDALIGDWIDGAMNGGLTIAIDRGKASLSAMKIS